MQSPNDFHLPPSEDVPVQDVWPVRSSVSSPKHLKSPTSQSQRRLRLGVTLGAVGGILGFFLIASGFSPLVKVYSGWAAPVLFLLLSLSLFLGRCAWQEGNPTLSGLLWLTCGMASLWTVLQFLVQSSMQ